MKGMALSLALGYGLLTLPHASAQHTPSGSTDPSPSQPPASALPWLKLEGLTDTRERPLFALDRRPQPPATPPPAVPAPQPEPSPRAEFVLKGIISGGEATFVLLEDVNSSETVLVREGDTIGDWRIQVESERSVTLVGHGERIKLQMFEEDRSNSE